MRRWFSILRYRVWPEVRQTWPFLLFCLGPVAAWLIAGSVERAFGGGLTNRLRYFGTLLQLFGIGLVAIGIGELQRAFNRPTVFAAMRARAAAIWQSLRSGDRTAALTGVAGIGLTGLLAAGYGRVGGTVEQRLDGMEREIDDLRKQADERQRKLESKLSDLRGELSKETQERIEAHARINAKLDDLAVGGLYLDVIGLWWLVVATVATSVPDEIVSLWRAAWP